MVRKPGCNIRKLWEGDFGVNVRILTGDDGSILRSESNRRKEVP